MIWQSIKWRLGIHPLSVIRSRLSNLCNRFVSIIKFNCCQYFSSEVRASLSAWKWILIEIYIYVYYTCWMLNKKIVYRKFRIIIYINLFMDIWYLIYGSVRTFVRGIRAYGSGICVCWTDPLRGIQFRPFKYWMM